MVEPGAFSTRLARTAKEGYGEKPRSPRKGSRPEQEGRGLSGNPQFGWPVASLRGSNKIKALRQRQTLERKA